MLPRLFVAVLLACLSAAGQSDYSIRSYDLRVEPNFVAGNIRIRTSIAIQNPRGLTKFEFGASPAYKTSLAGRSTDATLEVVDGEARIQLRNPARELLLEFESTGSPGKSNGEDRPVIDADSLFLLWSDRWYPIDFDHWAPVRTTVVLPKEFKVIAPGKVVSDKSEGSTRTVVFQERNPAVAFSVFADRRWVEEERTIAGYRIRTLLHPESKQWAEQIFSTSPDVLKFFTELHGFYPFQQFGFVTVAGMGGRRAFSGFIGYGPSYLDSEMKRTGYDAHETSLLWWDNTTRGSGPGSWQWTEGFGDYVEPMYVESRNRPLAGIFKWFRDQYLAIPPEQDVPYTELRGNSPQKIVHGKYPWLMHVLRLGIGDGAFKKGIRLLFQRYARRTFTMDEFVAVFEQASGTSLAWWRKDWLESRGALVASFDSQVEEEDGGFIIRMTLTQQEPARRVPAEIGMRTASGTEIRRMIFEPNGAPVELASPDRPLEVTFDPDGRLPVRIVPPDKN